MVAYTDAAKVSGVKITDTPLTGYTVSGYGGKIPTRYMVRYQGSTGTFWHRVYVMNYGNAGTAYVKINGVRHVLDIETEYRLVDAV